MAYLTRNCRGVQLSAWIKETGSVCSKQRAQQGSVDEGRASSLRSHDERVRHNVLMRHMLLFTLSLSRSCCVERRRSLLALN